MNGIELSYGKQIPGAAFFTENPGVREGQIMNFDGLGAGMDVVLVSPGMHIGPALSDPEDCMSRFMYGPDFYEEKYTVLQNYARFAGGISLGQAARAENYLQIVPDPNFVILGGRGEMTGVTGNQTYAERSALSFSKADLGMMPYQLPDGTTCWGVNFLRRVVAGKNYDRVYERRKLEPKNIVRHIPGTRFL